MSRDHDINFIRKSHTRMVPCQLSLRRNYIYRNIFIRHRKFSIGAHLHIWVRSRWIGWFTISCISCPQYLKHIQFNHSITSYFNSVHQSTNHDYDWGWDNIKIHYNVLYILDFNDYRHCITLLSSIMKPTKITLSQRN